MDQSCFGLIKKLRDWEEDNQRNVEARRKEFVLLLGETGSGKSTLTQFLVDDSELESSGCRGEYVITDKSGRISAPDKTILSHTIHPECLSSVSNISVCDCPGFGDSRSTEQDICCQFFTRNILGSFKAVKILFVISHAKMQSGGERTGFLNLVKHASEFMKNMKIFEKSIGLIVTKVENKIERIGNEVKLISDDEIKENIVVFLKTTKSTIEKEIRSYGFPVEKKTLYENAIEFIEILFGGRTETSRLGLFRQPDQPGPINEIDTMKVAKSSLNKIIDEALIFTKSEAADFSYALSEQSKLYIVDLIPNIVEILNPLISKSFEEILKRYRMLESSDDDLVENLVDEFSMHVEFWRKESKQLENLNSTTVVLNFLMDLSPPFEVPLDHNFNNDSKYYLELLRLFEDVIKKPLNCRTPEWISFFNYIKNFVQDCQIWYSTLQTTFSNLSNRTEILRNIGSNCLVDVNESMLKWVNQKTSVNGKEFKEIFDTVYEYGINDDFEISTVKLMHLMRLWDLYLVGLCPKVADQLKQLMKQLFEHVSRRYGQLEAQDDIDIEQLRCQFLKHAEYWKSTAAKLLKLDDTFEVLNVMLYHLENLPLEGAPVFDLNEDDCELRKEIGYYMEYLRNLEIATNQKFKFNSSDFIDPFDMVKDFAQNCVVWYSDLTRIFENLNNYEIRNFESSEWISLFDICLSDWLRQPPDIAITGRMFKDAFDVVKSDISDNFEINTTKLKHLKHSWTAYLDSLIPKIIFNLNELIASLFEGVIALYENLEGNHEVNLKLLDKMFSSHAQNWKTIGENLKTLEKSPDVLDELVKLLQLVDAEITGDGKSNRIGINQQDVDYYLNLMRYLEKANNFHSGIKNWLDAYNKARSYVDGSQVWYCTTLPTIESSLFSYDIQQKRGNESASAFEECLSDWLAKGKHVSGKQFKEIFDQISTSGVHDDLDISSAKLNHLQRLLSYASTSGTKDEIENKGDLLTIKKNVILLSSILESVTSNVRKLEVLASKELFIDCDWNATGRNMQCMFIAPEWNIVGGNRRIILDGSDGDPHIESKDDRNINGMDGNPGGCAGNFVGICSKIVKGEKLMITANGGKGGNGQNGMNGRNGRDGEKTEVVNKGKKAFSTKPVEKRTNGWNKFVKYFMIGEESNEYKLTGNEGEPGENGGNGGVAGFGGYPGIITLIGFNRESSFPQVINSPGENGEPGRGGGGGKGGKHGGSTNLVLTDNLQTERTQFETCQVKTADSAVNGKDGLDGQSAIGMLNVKNFSFEYLGPSLDKYLTYVRDNLKRGPYQAVTNPFTVYLEKNVKFQRISSVSDLARRFAIAEQKIGSTEAECIDNYSIVLYDIFDFICHENFSAEKVETVAFLFVAALCRQTSSTHDLRRMPQPTKALHLINFVLNNGNKEQMKDIASFQLQLLQKLFQNENIDQEVNFIKEGIKVNNAYVRQQASIFTILIRHRLGKYEIPAITSPPLSDTAGQSETPPPIATPEREYLNPVNILNRVGEILIGKILD